MAEVKEKVDGFKIYCYKDTAGEKYAKDNGFDYVIITDRLVGDANGDGKITADDAIITARFAAGYGNYKDTYDPDVCDMNRDGQVTADDAIIIARYAAGYSNYRDTYTNYI